MISRVGKVSLKTGACRISKSMHQKARNKEEASKKYSASLQGLIDQLTEEDGDEAQSLYKKVAKDIRDTWHRMVLRRPQARSPHWNANL